MYTDDVYLKIMLRTQTYITDEQKKNLESYTRKTGKKQAYVIRLALDTFFTSEKKTSKDEKKKKLLKCFGMWDKRDDLDDSYFENVRKSGNRNL